MAQFFVGLEVEPGVGASRGMGPTGGVLSGGAGVPLAGGITGAGAPLIGGVPGVTTGPGAGMAPGKLGTMPGESRIGPSVAGTPKSNGTPSDWRYITGRYGPAQPLSSIIPPTIAAAA